MNEQSDNLADHYRENSFDRLVSPLALDTAAVAGDRVAADEGGRSIARAVAEHWGLPYLDEQQLVLDGDSVARVGVEELAHLRAVPVRTADGGLAVVVAEATNERFAAVREHFSTDVAVGIVTPQTLEWLVRAARTEAPASEEAAASSALGQTVERLLGFFDEEAGRFQLLRQKLQQLTTQVSERERRLAQVESELSQARLDSLRDRETIERLRHELAEREGRLERAAVKARELGAVIQGGGLG